MAIGVDFDKSKAAYFIDCLANQKPIAPPNGAWTADDMLALAGASFFVVMSHGPWLNRDIDMSKLPPEHREAKEETFFEDIHVAIEYYGHLSMLVQDDEYDTQFEPRHRAVVFHDTEGKKVIPVDGVKA